MVIGTQLKVKSIGYEKNNLDYCVEVGTFLPLRKRLADLKQAGLDLLAYRRALADFENGTQSLDLEDYDNELRSMDEIDFFNKKRYFDELFAKQAEEQKKLAEEKYKAEVIEDYKATLVEKESIEKDNK